MMQQIIETSTIMASLIHHVADQMNGKMSYCLLMSKLVQSSHDFVSLFPYVESSHESLALCLCISLCGVSDVLRKFVIILYIISFLVIEMGSISHQFNVPEKITSSYLFVSCSALLCTICIVMRYIEVKYGPRRIPDVHRSYLSLTFLCKCST